MRAPAPPPSLPRPRGPIATAAVATLVAIGVNGALLALLAVLNAADAGAERPWTQRTASIFLEDLPARAEATAVPAEAPAPAPEVLTVDLDLPAPVPTVLDLDPLDVDVLALGPSVVSIAAVPTEPPPGARTARGSTPARAPARGTGTPGRVDVPPRELPGNPEPRYPPEAVRAGLGGWVRVRLLVDVEGRVADLAIVDAAGHEAFANAVLAVLPRWRFQPAMLRGRPVAVWALKRFRFEVGG